MFKNSFAFLSLVLIALSLTISCGNKDSATPSGNSSTDDGGGDSGGGGGGGSGVVVVTPAFGYLFATTASTNGGFAWTGTYPGDLTLVADPMCATEAGILGLTGTFRAVLGENTLRKPGTNWVLKNSTEYRRADGTTVIGSTDASGTLQFPLTNSIGTAAGRVWTGLTSATQPEGVAHCGGWSDSTFTSQGRYGDLSLTTSAAISSSTDSCDTTYPLLCAQIIPRTTTIPAQAAYRRIFVTDAVLTAGTGLLGADGAVRFDNLCQSEANTAGISDGGYTSYKALVHTNTTGGATRRVSCLTAFCGSGPGEAVNWVLEPSTEYRRVDGTTVIATTNANAVFDFPLQNSFTAASKSFWTGFTETWASATNSNVGNCTYFQINSSAPGVEAYTGDSGATGTTAINAGLVSCSLTRAVLCVEQKRTQNVFVDYPGYN